MKWYARLQGASPFQRLRGVRGPLDRLVCSFGKGENKRCNVFLTHAHTLLTADQHGNLFGALKVHSIKIASVSQRAEGESL